MTMIKKIAGVLVILAAIVLGCYWLQGGKTGVGIDTSIRYEPVAEWPDLPKDLKLGNPTGIDVDTDQNIVVFHRADRKWPLLGAMPKEPIDSKTILIIDKDNGKLINSWGNGLFVMPHGLKVDRENNIWITDVGLHQVMKFSHDGRILMKLGVALVPGNDSTHFNKPTDIAIATDGSFYVSDGYGNNRVIKFSREGKYLFEWGDKGSEKGAFDIPHGISLDGNGNVYVADRENNRVQVFDPAGRFIKQFADNSYGRMCGVEFHKPGSILFAVDDHAFMKLKHRGSDILAFDIAGTVQTRLGRSGSYSGGVSWYHDLAVDADKSVYVGDILNNRIQKFRRVH
jgi:peptidylamidoglycolate lyase